LAADDGEAKLAGFVVTAIKNHLKHSARRRTIAAFPFCTGLPGSAQTDRHPLHTTLFTITGKEKQKHQKKKIKQTTKVMTKNQLK